LRAPGGVLVGPRDALTTATAARTWHAHRIVWLQAFLHLYWFVSATACVQPHNEIAPDRVALAGAWLQLAPPPAARAEAPWFAAGRPCPRRVTEHVPSVGQAGEEAFQNVGNEGCNPIMIRSLSYRRRAEPA
jgi:hypothetical protein